MHASEERRWRLRAACNMADLSKSAVADALGVDRSALSHWEQRGDGLACQSRGGIKAKDIAEAISQLGNVACPVEALQAGSDYRPEWVRKT